MIPPELKKLYRDGRLLPFVGAGVSASVTWRNGEEECHGPSWNELVERAAHELGFKNIQLVRARGTDLQILEYFKLQFSGYARLTNWLVRNMNPSDATLNESAIHNELVEMKKCSVIYTTNFGCFFREVLLRAEDFRPKAA